jgi:putative flippase GtrA
MKQLLRYCAVGVVNTAVGYAIFWVCLRLFGFTPGISNTKRRFSTNERHSDRT